MEVTTAIHLDTRRQKKDKTYPVKIRVTYNRVRKYYTITNHKDSTANRYSLLIKDYEDMMAKNVRGELKNLKEELEIAEKKARDIIKSMDSFSFGYFEQLFNERTANKHELSNVKLYFDKYIAELKKEGQIGTAYAYNNAKNSLFSYWQESLRFDEITAGLLNNYKRKMLEGNKPNEIAPKSKTTVSIYTRCLKSLYNSAIKDGIVNQKLYPFGKGKDGKFEIPKPNNFKKALPIEDIQKIFEYMPKSDTESFYRDIWIFMYLSYGMNIGDLCDIKFSHINNGKINFTRNKTENKNPIQLQVLLTDKHYEIINNYKATGEYIFPILESNYTPEVKRQKIRQFTNLVNKYIKQIAKEIEIDENLSTQFCRHSFATIARNGKIPDGIISQLMGHALNSGVTSNYFSNEVPDFILKEVNRVLIDWK